MKSIVHIKTWQPEVPLKSPAIFHHPGTMTSGCIPPLGDGAVSFLATFSIPKFWGVSPQVSCLVEPSARARNTEVFLQPLSKAYCFASPDEQAASSTAPRALSGYHQFSRDFQLVHIHKHYCRP